MIKADGRGGPFEGLNRQGIGGGPFTDLTKQNRAKDRDRLIEEGVKELKGNVNLEGVKEFRRLVDRLIKEHPLTPEEIAEERKKDDKAQSEQDAKTKKVK